MQVFARMDFIADIDAVFIGMIEDRLPAAGEFLKCRFHQAGRTLRPWIDERPCQRTGKGRMRADAEIARCTDRHLHLLNRPLLARLGIAAHFGHREAIESFIIGRVHRDELALQMRRKLRDFDTVLTRHTGEFVTIILRFRSLFQIDQLARPCGNLHPGIAFFGGPFGDAIPCIERRFIACELPRKMPGPLIVFIKFLLNMLGPRHRAI